MNLLMCGSRSTTPTGFASWSTPLTARQARSLPTVRKFSAIRMFSLHKDHPVQFPKSAYAYTPGLDLDQYAAEQMANGIEHREKNLLDHVKSVTRNAADSKNVTALTKVQFADRRIPGVKF